MTEAEWLTCKDPDSMCEVLEIGASDRKLRLVASACCRRIWPHLSASCSRRVVELVELVADGVPLASELETTALEAMAYAESPEGRSSESGCSAAFTAAYATESDPGERLVWVASRTAEQVRGTFYWSAQESRDLDGDLVVTKAEAEGDAARRAEEKVQTALLRDIFGNPFRPVACPPSWRTDMVMLLVRQLYESRDFSAMPILGDALQDAGCDDSDVLNHCRFGGVHVRGCWVVDLVLGRE